MIKKIGKRLLGGICVLALSISLFSFSTIAFAVDPPVTPVPSSNQSLLDMAATLDIVLNVLYIIIRPLLAITGLALDNSLVYGEVFNMTAMLRKFRTVVMQISFILLALMILRDIVKMLRGNKIQAELPKKIKNWFLAGILIPASWFIVAALVDLSTILIYQVGSIPLTLMAKDDPTRILNNSSIINLTDKLGNESDEDAPIRFTTTFSCGNKTYLPCQFIKNKITTDSRKAYIDSSKLSYPNLADQIEAGKDFCALSPTMLIDINKGDFDMAIDGIFETASAKGKTEMQSEDCMKIGDLITKSKSMVGPLYTIYGSLLNFTSLNVTVSGKSTESEVMLFLIKAIVGVLLVIPLIVLAFVSLARVGILRMVIAFSPLIILNKFVGKDSMVGEISKNMNQTRAGAVKFSMDSSQIIQTIFQPVVVVLALGLSLVFLSATNQILGPAADKKGLLQAIGIEIDNKSDPDFQKISVSTNDQKTSVINMRKFEGEYSTSVFFDYFTWIIANIFGILIMWKMMFMALGSAAMTKSMVGKMQKYGEDYLSSRPLFNGYSWDSVNQIASGVTNEAIKRITEDKTVKAAEEYRDYVTSRFPGSKAYAAHNGKFAYDGNDPNEALEKLASGIGSVQADNKNFHYLNASDAPNMSALASKAGIKTDNSNMTDLAKNNIFRERMAQNEKGRSVLKQIMNEANSPEKLQNMIGLNSTAQNELKAALASRARDLRGIGNGNSEGTVSSRVDYGNSYVFSKTTGTKSTVKGKDVYNYTLDDIFAAPKKVKDRTPDQVQSANSIISGNKEILNNLGVAKYDPQKKIEKGVYIKDETNIIYVTEEEAKTANTPPAPANPSPPASQAGTAAAKPGTPATPSSATKTGP